MQTPPPPEKVAFEFGAALAAGDYQGDGVADLFIGVPALSLGLNNVGGVEIRPGVAGVGLGPGPSYLLLHQGTSQPGQTWVPEEHNLAFVTEDDEDPFIFRGERMGHRWAGSVTVRSARGSVRPSARVAGPPGVSGRGKRP